MIGAVITIAGLIALLVVLEVPITATAGALGALAGAFLLWRVSLFFGPLTNCWRCKGRGSYGGILGGKHRCGFCGGSGLRRRIGAGE